MLIPSSYQVATWIYPLIKSQKVCTRWGNSWSDLITPVQDLLICIDRVCVSRGQCIDHLFTNVTLTSQILSQCILLPQHGIWYNILILQWYIIIINVLKNSATKRLGNKLFSGIEWANLPTIIFSVQSMYQDWIRCHHFITVSPTLLSIHNSILF